MNLLLQAEEEITSQLDIEKSLEQLIIHIRTIKRNGRKFWTVIEGLEQVQTDELMKIKGWKSAKGKDNMDKLCFIMRNIISGGGSVQIDKTNANNKVIQLQGNHRDVITQFLINHKLASEDNIKCHG